MVEITLPCCDIPASLEAGADEVRCEACGVVHELAPDAREPALDGPAVRWLLGPLAHAPRGALAQVLVAAFG